MDDEEFQKLVDEVVAGIPNEFLEKLENVAIVIEDWPNSHQLGSLKMTQNSLLFGLYEGIPQTKRGRYGVGATLPDKITVFKIPLLMISKDYHTLKNNVADTVIHEIAHHFGMSEADIRRSKRN
jgi:predicted Zn-dependent protease with MMP-like domain